MAENRTELKDVFDFSQDAQAFKARLWQQIRDETNAPSLQPLEDEELAFLNAAGVSHPAPPPEENKDNW